jgi:hypothetical protein
MGIVRFALRWPYTFYVLALLILFLGELYSAAMRSQVISRCFSLSPARCGGGMRTIGSPSKRTPRT